MRLRRKLVVANAIIWISEIRLRACMRIGELSRELEKAKHGGSGGGSKLPAMGISKEQTLAEAGLSGDEVSLTADWFRSTTAAAAAP